MARQVARLKSDEGLAAARIGRGEHDNVRYPFLSGHELKVGAHHAESLVDHVAALLLYYYGAFFFFMVTREPVSFPAECEWYFSHKRDSQVFQVLATTNHRIHIHSR